MTPQNSTLPGWAQGRAAGVLVLCATLTAGVSAGCGGTGVGSTGKALGEGCCIASSRPDDQPCSLGTCEDGLECYLVPEGPNITRGVCVAPCVDDGCESPGARCIFDRCMPVCEVPEDHFDDPCIPELSCRSIHSVGFCIP